MQNTTKWMVVATAGVLSLAGCGGGNNAAPPSTPGAPPMTQRNLPPGAMRPPNTMRPGGNPMMRPGNAMMRPGSTNTADEGAATLKAKNAIQGDRLMGVVVHTSKGVMHLTGTVSGPDQRATAERLARQATRGAFPIQNEIQVGRVGNPSGQ